MPWYSKLASKLYEQRDKSGDVTFIVETEQIRAYRNVLAALSEKYEAQFYGPHPDEGDIQVNGVTAAAFEDFLKLFYFVDVELSIENIGDVLDLAKQSLNDDFVSECIEFLKRNVAINNLCSIYRLAITYDAGELKDLCEEKMSNNTKALFATEDFVNCDREVLEGILKQNSLSCSECEVFDACISWVRAVCEQKHIDTSKPANLRAELGNLITHVRLASMTLDEFAIRQKSLKNFFTPDEINEIMYIIEKLDDLQSEKFYQTRREQSEEESFLHQNRNTYAHSLLECNLIIYTFNWSKVYSGVEHFGLKCNQNIRWHGFIIASENNTGVAQIGRGSMTMGYENIRIFIDKTNNDETVVHSVHPVDVVADEWHFIKEGSTVFGTL